MKTDSSDRQVDSFRFVSIITRKLMQGWYPKEPVRDIPWTPPARPMDECRVALISSAALVAGDDPPFDQQGERDRPWWGDPGFRRIPRDTQQVKSYHLHINNSHAEKDMNSVFPLHRLAEMEAERLIGSAAATHYSFMGYLPDAGEFLEQTVPKIIASLQDQRVDIVLLVPV